MADRFSRQSSVFLATVQTIFAHYSLAFLCIYVLFVKDCFEVLLWALIMFTKRFTWVLHELCNNSSWKVYLEEIGNDEKEPLFSKQSPTTMQNKRKSSFRQQKTNYEIYMCHSCKRRNKSLISPKRFKLSTPPRDEVRGFANQNSNDSSFPVLHQNFKTELLACKSSSFSPTEAPIPGDKGLEPRSTFPNKNDLKNTDRIKNFKSNTRQLFDSIKFGKPFFRDFKQKSFKLDGIKCQNNLHRSNSETLPKEIDLKTPPRKRCYIDLGVPLSEFKFNPNRNRYKLVHSNEDDESPPIDKVSIVKKSWEKWRQACVSFKKRSESKSSLISNLDD